MSMTQTLPAGFSPAANCLQGKTILVTGAGDGIGRTAALAYAQRGATVILLGKTLAKLEAVYDEIASRQFPQAALCPFDLNTVDPVGYKQLAETIQSNFGKLDGLLHNAGILGSRNSLESYKAKQWFEVMQVNVNSAFLLTQALLPLLKKFPSSIVFTSSGVGQKGRAYWGAYSVSKFATEGLMQVLADEMENTTSVRVNSVNPGPTRTRMRATAYPAEDPQTVKSADALIPLYLYLMCDDSVGVNGKSFDA